MAVLRRLLSAMRIVPCARVARNTATHSSMGSIDIIVTAAIIVVEAVNTVSHRLLIATHHTDPSHSVPKAVELEHTVRVS